MADPYTFDAAVWKGHFPEFTAVPDGQASFYFLEACQYWRNDGTSPNSSPTSQQLILELLTSHIAALYAQSQGSASPGGVQDANTPVGRISSATVGSVTVQTELNLVPKNGAIQAWASQTKYGLQWLSMTTAYRRGGVYMVGCGPSGGGPLPGPY